jgi:glycosyltransferase involved in cell wall biosynthesis
MTTSERSGESGSAEYEQPDIVIDRRARATFLLTVVMTVKNGAPHLPGFILERLREAWRDEYELVMIDDGSSDDTRSRLLDISEKISNSAILANRHSCGAGVTREQAIRAARGEYVWFVDCDDDFPPRAPELLLQKAIQSNADVVIGRAVVARNGALTGQVIDALSQDFLGGVEALDLLLSGGIHGYLWNKIFRRSTFTEIHPPLISTQEDVCRTALGFSRSGRVAIIHDVVYIYVQHGQSTLRSSTPRLENLDVSRRYVLGLVRDPGRAKSVELTHYFNFWYYSLAALSLPIYACSAALVRKDGRRRAREMMDRVAVRRFPVYVSRAARLKALTLKYAPLLLALWLKSLVTFRRSTRVRRARDLVRRLANLRGAKSIASPTGPSDIAEQSDLPEVVN